MERNPLLKKYQSKLVAEGLIKSFMVAMSVAFGVGAIIAFAFWFTPYSGTWYAVGAMIVIAAALTPTFYFCKYRPTDADIARRLDRLGLEERFITMNELQGDTSDLAKLQANDALQKLHSSSVAGSLRIAISWLLFIPLAISFAFGGTAVTVGALADAGVIRSGNEVIENIFSPDDEQYYAIRYTVLGMDLQTGETYEEEGGFIDGNADQIVPIGGDATPVIAVADDDWIFLCWDLNEAMTDPYRCDTQIVATGDNAVTDEAGNITVTYTAYFVVLPEGGGDGDGQQGDDEQPPSEGDQPQDAPSDGNEQETPPSPGDSEPGEDGGNEGGGDYDKQKDQIIDGKTDYRSVYDDYCEQLMEMLESDEIPEKYKKIIKDYLGIIV